MAKEERVYIRLTESEKQGFQTAAALAGISLSSWIRERLRLAAIRDLESAGQQIPFIERPGTHLEHVLPERPDGNWPQFSEDDVGQYSKRLGNLALMLAKDNADLKSATFAEKKAVYQHSPYELTSEIATYDDWTPKTIVARQERLAELAVKAWPAA